MKFLADMLSNGKGMSSMRVMAMLCCLTAIGLAFIGINKPAPDYSGLSMLCGTFLAGAMVGKTSQKAIENKTTPDKSV